MYIFNNKIKISYIIYFLLLALLSCNKEPEIIKNYYHGGEEAYDVVLVAGQSNTYAGVLDSTIKLQKDTLIKQLGRFLDNNYQIINAEEPLDHSSRSEGKIGFAMTFCLEYLKDGALKPGRKLLIIPCGNGGTGFSDNKWNPGNPLYNDAIDRCNFILGNNPQNKLVAILWHQGENDVPYLDMVSYQKALDRVILTSRKDIFRATSVPVIVGGMVPYWVNKYYKRILIQNKIASTPKRIPFTGYADPTIPWVLRKPNDEVDIVHYNARQQIEMGKRYYQEFKRIAGEPIVYCQDKRSFDVILLAGQANTYSGEGYKSSLNEVQDTVIYQLGRFENDFKIISAKEPLDNHNKPGDKSGFAIPFAKEYYSKGMLKENRKILIIPCGLGSSGFKNRKWNKGDEIYFDAVNRVNYVLKGNPDNKLVAILWHQGEEDVEYMTDEQYAEALDKMIGNMRNDIINSRNVPFILGGMAPSWVYLNPKRKLRQEIIKNTVNRVENTSYADPTIPYVLSKSYLLPNIMLYTSDQLVDFGKRYFNAYTSLLSNSPINDDNKEFDIILLAGEANTYLGEGYKPQVNDVQDTLIYQLGRFENDFKVIPAKEPLDNYGKAEGKSGFALSFAREYHKRGMLEGNRKILIIPCGFGSSGFKNNKWNKGNILYNDAVLRTNLLLSKNSKNKLVAILWHQGEEDVEWMSVESYAESLDRMIFNLRQDIVNCQNVPFILGGMAPSWVYLNPKRMSRQDVIKNTVNRVENTAYADPTIPYVLYKSYLLPNLVLYTSGQLVELGKRYFSAYLSLISDSQLTEETQEYDIILLAGEANTYLGDGYEPLLNRDKNENIYQLGRFENDFKIIQAIEPLDNYGKAAGKSGFALSFANEYLNKGMLKANRKILIIPCGYGSSGFKNNKWNKGDILYNDAVLRTNLLLSKNSSNKLVAILWQQGEEDVEWMNEESYAESLDRMISNIRNDIINGHNVPFILGGMAPSWVYLNPKRTMRQEIIKNTVKRVENTAYADPTTPYVLDKSYLFPDIILYTSEHLNELGKRYFNAYYSILNHQPIIYDTKPYDIILVIGQSNTYSGTGLNLLIDKLDIQIIKQLGRFDNNYKIIDAVPPLDHTSKTSGKIGFVESFSKEYTKYYLKPGRELLIIPCGNGGTGFADRKWNKGDILYNDAVFRTNLILSKNSNNKLVAILWHQGENDVTWMDHATYTTKLDEMIKNIRKDILNSQNVPFILGGMVPYWVQVNQKRKERQLIIQKTRERISNTGYANPYYPFLLTRPDNTIDTVHYNADQQRELGKRYFYQFDSLSVK